MRTMTPVSVPVLPMLVLLALLGALAARGAESPYAGEEGRPIKALSADEVAGYLAGAGMGYAKVAELNHHPGPMHVLELAEPLALTAEQRRAVEAAEARMRGRAVDLGRRVVEAEAALDALFAAGGVEEADLRRRLHEIADLEAELRLAHLAAHLETRALLSEEQIARYDELRGYGGGDPAHHQPPENRGHPGHHG